MFSEFVTIDVIRIEGSDLVNGSVKRDTVLIGSDNVTDGITVGFGSPIVIKGKCWVIIEDRFTEGFFLVVVFSVVISWFRHSSPPYKARIKNSK